MSQGNSSSVGRCFGWRVSEVRFSRCPYRYQRRAITRQRLTAATKAIERERQRDGLFADVQAYETPEERLARLEAEQEAWVRQMRARWLEEWRRIRAALCAAPAERRRQIVAAWRTCGWPGSPEYIATFLRKHGVIVRPELDEIVAQVRRIRETVEREMAERQAVMEADAAEQMALF